MIKIKRRKKQFSQEQEFEILKLVLDKFLWVGVLIALYGLFLLISETASVGKGLSVLAIGAFFLLALTSIIAKNVHFHKA